MRDSFSLEFVSIPECDFLVAEISFRGQLLCRLNREKGIENLEIEFDFDKRILSEEVDLRFPLGEFMEALKAAANELVRAS